MTVLLANIKPIMTTYGLDYTKVKSKTARLVVLTVVAFKIHVFLDVTLCRLVINYRRFEHSHVVHKRRLGLLDPEDEGTAIFRKGETIYQSTQCHPSRCIFNRNIRSKELSVYRCYPSSGVDKAPFNPRRRWPQHVHNTLSFSFIWSGFLSADRRQYSGSLLQGLEVISQITIGVVRLFAPMSPT